MPSRHKNLSFFIKLFPWKETVKNPWQDSSERTDSMVGIPSHALLPLDLPKKGGKKVGKPNDYMSIHRQMTCHQPIFQSENLGFRTSHTFSDV